MGHQNGSVLCQMACYAGALAAKISLLMMNIVFVVVDFRRI